MYKILYARRGRGQLVQGSLRVALLGRLNGGTRFGVDGVQKVFHPEQMANEIIQYIEMCRREGVSLQRGMNFGIGGTHSVILMSLRSNAPYADRIEADGTVLIYEGHDEPRSTRVPEPKAVDQPRSTVNGRLTQNGQFEVAAIEFKAGTRQPERVRVYEKIYSGIWSYNGMFHLLTLGLNRLPIDLYSSSGSRQLRAKKTSGIQCPCARSDEG
jgi:hypothetical protein